MDIEIGSGLVLAVGSSVRILIYKELGVERHPELFVGKRNRCRLALLIDDRPLPQSKRIVAEHHRQTAAIWLSFFDDRYPQCVRTTLEAGNDEVAEGDRL